MSLRSIIFTLCVLFVALAHGKLTIHLVSHTHDDIGWLKTVDQYQWGLNMSIQPAHVNAIISSVVGGLLEDPARRFTYVEIGYFSRWWAQQNDAVKENVRMLAGTGRLQFANGGWCMHDEAAAHFVDMIDQTTIGHRFLKQQLNAVPKVGWQVDPFGHSATQAAMLSAKAGFLSTFHGRTDYQDYNYRTQNLRKQREFWWQASPSLPDLKVLGEIMLGPTYCTRSNAFSWDLMDEVGNFNSGKRSNYIVDDPQADQYNIPKVLETFAQIAQNDAIVTNGNNIMWTMGCDFNYVDSTTWFNNIEKLIKAVNADGRFEAKYSTPYDYTLAKIYNDNVSFSYKYDDFFPYADGPHQFWTGYFTSRAALKRYIRTVSSYWTASRQIQYLAGIPTGEVPTIADALGIAQHHDAVAGTSKQHVAFDYAKRIYKGYNDDLTQRLSPSVKSILGTSVQHCPLMNISECDVTYTKLKTSQGTVDVIVWNPLGQAREATIEIPVPTANVKAVGGSVVSFTGPFPSSAAVTNYAQSNPNWQPYTIAVQVKLPAAGSATFTLTSTSSTVESKQPVSTASGQDLVVKTQYLTVTFSGTNGMMSSIAKTNVTVSVQQDYCYFASNPGDSISNQAGGAYIFRPVTNSNCVPLATSTTASVIAQSSNYFVVEQTFGYVTQRVIGEADKVNIEFTVNGIPISDNIGKELIMRFQTNISNQGIAYTDSNGREMQQRKKDYRPSWPLVQTEEVAGNYYPINALMFIKDPSAQLNVFTDSSVGGGSINNGEMYVTVHRRILVDDSRGVGEPLNETEFVVPYVDCDKQPCGQHQGAPLIIRGRFTVTVEQATTTSMRRTRQVQDEVYFSPLVMFADQASNNTVQSVLSAPLPSQLQLLTVQLLDADTALVRLSHKFAVSEDPLLSAPVNVQLTTFLVPPTGRKVLGISEFSLTGNEILKESVTATTITAMDIKTFVYRFG